MCIFLIGYVPMYLRYKLQVFKLFSKFISGDALSVNVKNIRKFKISKKKKNI